MRHAAGLAEPRQFQIDRPRLPVAPSGARLPRQCPRGRVFALVAAQLGRQLGERREADDDTPGGSVAEDLRGHLDAQLFDRITLAEAGRILEVSPAHLVRSFTHRFGISPHRYLVGRRIEAARRQLLDGLPVARPAADVGFHDQAHLTRHFKRHVGTTPGGYRAD
jgi:AraC-like DNA-binding protein